MEPGNCNRPKYDIRDQSIAAVDSCGYMRFVVETILLAFLVRKIADSDDGVDALKTLQTFP